MNPSISIPPKISSELKRILHKEKGIETYIELAFRGKSKSYGVAKRQKGIVQEP
jgi:hypothetical protein